MRSSLHLFLQSQAFLSFSVFQLSFLFFCTLSISVSWSCSFQSSRHWNIWYSLAKEKAGLFKVDTTIGEVKNPSSPLLEWGGFLSMHGFQCYSDSLDSLWSAPVWVSYKQLCRTAAWHELSQRDAHLHVFLLQKLAMSEPAAIWSVKHHVALKLLLLKWKCPANYNAVPPALLPWASPLRGAGRGHLFPLGPTILYTLFLPTLWPCCFWTGTTGCPLITWKCQSSPLSLSFHV